MKKLFLFFVGCFLLVFFVFILYEHVLFLENIPVLAYHDVSASPTEETDIKVEDFERQMKYISKHFNTLSLNEFFDWKTGDKMNGKNVVLTFDDGKESFYTTVVPLLEKYNLKGTIFVIESAIGMDGYLSRAQVEDLKMNHPNIMVASHSYNLHGEEAARSNDFQIYDEDMKKNENNGYVYYAYPFGIHNDAYKEALKENDYKMAFLFSPSKWANRSQDYFEITRVPIYKSNSFWKFKLKLHIKI